MGAWIEILSFHARYKTAAVAPLVGAWIEIVQTTLCRCRTEVAPLVGAWIEIKCTVVVCAERHCRSPRGSVD